MPLTTRVCVFFLAALAVVLVGFSAALYLLASDHLNTQLDDRLTAALDSLSAVAELEPGGFDWEPHERLLALRNDPTLQWAVYDPSGKRIDGRPAEGEFPPPGRLNALIDPPNSTLQWQDQDWRVSIRNIRAPAPPTNVAPSDDPKQVLYRSLTLSVAAPVAPVRSALIRLALVLIGLSVAVWLSSAAAGRWVCRRALRPVADMAAAARSIRAAEHERRLPAAGTKDELDDLAGAFNGLLDRLQEAFERQRNFTGEASHQLRTPLAAMLGQAEVALRRDRRPEEYRRALESVRSEADHLRRIVEMLLFLARADSEAKAPDPERIDLVQWLTTHLKRWADRPRAADLRTELPAEPLETRIHGELFGQALDNLLDNACRFSAAGTPVTVWAWRESGEACVAVSDEGCGIAAEELPRVFEPFFRSKDARRLGVNGVGLGLAVVSRIVTVLGGRVEVESEPGRGSRFTIRLPEATGIGGPHGFQRESRPLVGG
jgi:heavy metal sensor kinase